MAFPISPTSGTTHGVNSRVWSFNGYAWDRLDLGGTGGGGVGPAGPTGPTGAGGALGNWGSFWSTQNQSATAANTAYAIQFNNTDPENSGVSLVDNTKITFAYKGVYNLQFSAQVANVENNQVNEATFWLKKNGTNIPDTAGVVSVDGKHSGVTGYALPAWNWMFGISANDYIELYWHTNDTNVSLNAFPEMASPPHPLSPSVIFTAQQVMFTQLGPTGATGATGLRGNTGATGPSDIQSTNSSVIFYPLFAGGTGNTAIYIDNVTTPLTYQPSTGKMVAKSFTATAANGNSIVIDSTSPPSISLTDVASETNLLFFNTSYFTVSSYTSVPTGNAYTFRGSHDPIWFRAPQIGFVSNDLTYYYFFPQDAGTSGQALLTRGSGATLYWGTVSNTNGATGATGATGDPGIQGPTGATGPVGDYVISFNGLTGIVEGVSSVNGFTGAISNVAFTNQGNTFSVIQVLNAGLSATSAITFNAATVLVSNTTAVDPLTVLHNSANSLKVGSVGNGRVGAVRLGNAATSTQNTFITQTDGTLTLYNGISTTGSNMLSISTSALNIPTTISGATFSGLIRASSGISASGGITSQGRLNAYAGICASGITTGQFYASAGATVANTSGVFSLQFNPSVAIAGGEQTKLNLQVYDSLGPNAWTATLIPNNSVNSDITHTLPSTTGTLLNTNSGVAFVAQGNTFSVRQVMNAGISASGGMTLFGGFNSYSGVSAAGITSDSGYRVSSGAINTQTSSYVLTGSDNGKIITMNSASGMTLTVPTGLPVGYTTTVIRLGSGNVGVSAAGGVTINSFQNQTNIAGQHAAVSLISYSSNVFNLAGGLTG